MSITTTGIHHVTAIAGDPQQNVDFYTDALGLRLVKRTVNFDDPTTYHLYYGDEVGAPGTILTFFPFEGARTGRVGAGQVSTTAFLAPPSSLDYWADRFDEFGVEYDEPTARFDERVLAFRDPDGLRLELVAHPAADAIEPWTNGPAPPEYAVRGLFGVSLSVADGGPTADLLRAMGFESVGEEDDRDRYRAGGAAEDGAGDAGTDGDAEAGDGDTAPVPETVVDLVVDSDASRGVAGAGTVHHVAFRAPDDETQLAWREQLTDRGLGVTPVRDRQYFRSIYFREPGGVLFEIATDPPGFALDEAVADLGTGLKLPPWLADDRERLEARLPQLDVRRGRPVADGGSSLAATDGGEIDE
ncbi:ring-cleaving dioxygenase [Halegenticoccus tardaugens]|uniref:ring-cleaving dioxygenase n=1 Tax=Halegenticoccus tardaugens TaxID=2071624 RepID=UPI00100BBAAA|nr:ring-cleaving dioxygenase [Halegenticoccus tardaugens]